jgi:hypothetical protein
MRDAVVIVAVVVVVVVVVAASGTGHLRSAIHGIDVLYNSS